MLATTASLRSVASAGQRDERGKMMLLLLLVAGVGLGGWSPDAAMAWADAPDPVRVTSNGEMLAPWPSDEEDTAAPDCRWWNGTHQFSLGACGAFDVTRLSRVAASTALVRARRCAADFETDCVLNSEIGFDIPAAFVYDESDGLKMVVAPRIIASSDDNDSGAADVAVRLQDPQSVHPSRTFRFNKTLTVEYIRGGTRVMETTTFRDSNAYCIQALRASVEAACWERLD